MGLLESVNTPHPFIGTVGLQELSVLYPYNTCILCKALNKDIYVYRVASWTFGYDCENAVV